MNHPPTAVGGISSASKRYFSVGRVWTIHQLRLVGFRISTNLWGRWYLVSNCKQTCI